MVDDGKNRREDESKAARNQHGGSATLGSSGTSQVHRRVVLRSVRLHRCTNSAVLLKTLLADVENLILVALQTSGEDGASSICGPA